MSGARLSCLLLFVALLGTAAGCYSPNPASGTLLCGPAQSCPQGYTCADGNTCWRQGEQPSDTRNGRLAKLSGQWFFSPGTLSLVTCSDAPNAPSSYDLRGQSLDVVPGVTSDLSAAIYCDWNLDLDPNANAASTVIIAGQSCQGLGSDGTTQFTWYGTSFEIATTDGISGTVAGLIDATFRPLAGAPGTCTVRIAGSISR